MLSSGVWLLLCHIEIERTRHCSIRLALCDAKAVVETQTPLLRHRRRRTRLMHVHAKPPICFLVPMSMHRIGRGNSEGVKLESLTRGGVEQGLAAGGCSKGVYHLQ